MSEDGTIIYPDIRNVQRAFGVQGPFALNRMRTDMGMQITQDLSYLMRSPQTKFMLTQQSNVTPAAGVLSLNTLIPVNAYLISATLSLTVDTDQANFLGGVCGYMPDQTFVPVTGPAGSNQLIPIVGWQGSAALPATNTIVVGNVAAQMVSFFRSIPMMQPLPVYMPAMTQLIYRARVSALFTGNLNYQALWVTTSPDGTTANSDRMEPIR